MSVHEHHRHDKVHLKLAIITASDSRTPETEGFGELFRMLSYQEIGTAAFLSRALAGTSNGKIVIALPGSPDACRLAMEKLLIPELGHMAHLLKL
jgi:molybdopterin biosynthesis enzyme MoaB